MTIAIWLENNVKADKPDKEKGEARLRPQWSLVNGDNEMHKWGGESMAAHYGRNYIGPIAWEYEGIFGNDWSIHCW